MNRYLKNALLAGAILFSSLASAAPACVSSSSDPDGDGWGWENNKSCKVVKGNFPFCSSAAVDPDGDGWGWENNKSCVVVDTPVSGFPVCSSPSADPDGDGWGWENNKSCKVVFPTDYSGGGTSSGGSGGSTGSGSGSTTSSPFDITNNMGAGWNLGNTLDSFGGETNWGNPRTTKAMIDTVKNAGFKTLRVPVTWDDNLSGSGYTIASWYLDRVEQVIKYGLDDGMYVIVNIHHNNGWEATTAKNEANAKDHIQKIWKQIATRLNKYDNHLIFETMNEPRNGDDWWGVQEYFNVVNHLNQAALDTIRGTGGNNAKRLVMIPSYCASANDYHINALVVPNDKMVAVSTHAYFPFSFSMDLSGTASFSDTSEVDSVFQRLNAKFISKGIPVVMGEWGTSNKNNLSERVKHAEYYAKAAKKVKIPTIWWDNANFTAYSSDSMGLFNRTGNYWVYPDIMNAIIRGSK